MRYIHPETARLAVPPHTVYLRQDRSQRAPFIDPALDHRMRNMR
jgi:hypothetical protein